MFGFGMPELIIILVIMLVAFGPAKLPQLGSALGGAIRNFKKGSEEPAALTDNGKSDNEKEPSSL
ncbi:twin-arginine translocation pathway protein, TatA/TatE family [Geotalea daltonii FRC-32]|uniref:Sec-independent protein translocase protein TatA n=1 Tax=Geotalea daltonii (strain DSM 22248 / JCM 15807 / FRC-32) TaxID=316067 RepID=B9M8E9_GEODF|nr:twin-arginine translocase TatA/TatE family subunit [Geotalea daltonii]ACM18484.1 twin-arginine translocation pathway protein, TatA/TatE family [Geotalea daltonii FRC-32]